MLTGKEQKFVEQNMLQFGHIVELAAPIFGEPFLHEGYLYYYDGCTATLFVERLAKTNEAQALKETITHIAEAHSPEGIIVWGHAAEKPAYAVNGYEIYYQEEIPFIHTELRIRNPRSSRKMKKALNRAQKEGHTWQLTELNGYRAEWLRLLAKTHEGKIMLSDLRLLLWYAMYPLSQRTKVLEVRKDDELVGIQIIYDNSPRYVCLAEIGYNESIRRAAEIVESLAINEYMGKTRILSVGGSPNDGVFRQKAELFQDPEFLYAGIPYWWIEYRKEGSNWNNLWWFERMLANKAYP